MKIAVMLALALAVLPSTAYAAQDISVTHAWSRPAIDTGIVYATIANHATRADRLDRVRCAIAQAAEVHRSMTMRAMPGMRDTGVMSMAPVRDLNVPARGTLLLAPGGNHVMLVGLRRMLRANETFLVQLHFARAGWIDVRVMVRPI